MSGDAPRQKSAYVPRGTTPADNVLAMVRCLRDERDEARQVVGFRERDLADLQRRTDRTLGYIRELLRGSLNPGVRMVCEAVEKSLTTPTANADPRSDGRDPEDHAYDGNGTSRCSCGYPMNAHGPA